LKNHEAKYIVHRSAARRYGKTANARDQIALVTIAHGTCAPFGAWRYEATDARSSLRGEAI